MRCSPVGYGSKLVASLEAILSTRDFGGPGPTGIEASLHLHRYGSAGRVELKERLELIMESADRGRPLSQQSAANPRWYLHVCDAKRMASPFLVRLSIDGIRALHDALSGALE